MANEDNRERVSAALSTNNEENLGVSTRRMSNFKEYKFFRSFSAKVENWPMRKAEALWRRMRERKIAGIKASINIYHKSLPFVTITINKKKKQ